MRFIKYDSRKILVDSDFQNFNILISYLIKKMKNLKMYGWDNKYNELNKESQYIWKEMHSADTICVC